MAVAENCSILQIMTKQRENSEIIFSVILAFRNEAGHLEECLRSQEAQSLARDRWELILVDSCSDDGSRKIADEFVSRNSICRLVEFCMSTRFQQPRGGF